MADVLTSEQRRKCMSRIRSKNTKPEIIIRKFLFAHGFRFRINVKRLPGTPDIVLRKYQTVIFVNGCFWHGHEGCRYFRLPKSNVDFWKNKIERNKECSSLNTGYGLSKKDSWFQGTRCSSSKLLLWLSPLDALCI